MNVVFEALYIYKSIFKDMYIEQLYTNCLSEAAYYIESDGVAAIIDPMRDIQPFLDLADKRGAKIMYVFETHFHADFVSGHLDLANDTGAKIIFGPGAKAGYEIHCAADSEEFELGSVTLKVLHTPGHTLESCCILLLDERSNPHSIFTGDTLFVGDVGRPDLAVSSEFSKEQLAGFLYDSIFNKILPLPNYVIIYPGHGAGSACGKSIGLESHSTIGLQKQHNYALKAHNKEEFIKLVVEGLNPPPKYFFMDAAINRNGYASLESVMTKNYKPLSCNQTISIVKNQSAVIIDTRPADEFSRSFIPRSLSISLDGAFASTAGSILNPEIPLIIVATSGREKEAVLRLARVGYENIAGFIDGGFDQWKAEGHETDGISNVNAEEFVDRFRYNSCVILDVRNPDEWVPGFVAGAKLIALPDLENQLKQIDSDKVCYVYCAGGYRSMVASSLLKKNGFHNVINVSGGMTKIRKTEIPIKQLSSSKN